MKRFLALFLLLLLLVGCSHDGKQGDTPQPDPPSSIPETYTGELTLNFAFGVRAGNYSGEINIDGLPDGYGTFTSENPSGNVWTYEGEWVDGHWEGVGTCTWSSGEMYSGEFTNDSETGRGTFTTETGERYEGTFQSRSIYGKGALYYTDGSSFTGIFTDLENAVGTYCDKDGVLREASINDGELVLIPLNDYFDDQQRQEQFASLYKSYKYSELVDCLNTYISENEIEPSDSAYAILDLITPALEYEDKWIVNFDEFDTEYILSFVGADRISSESSVAVSLKKTDLDIKIGFRKSGWLFFDHVALSIDGEQVYTASVKSYNTTRNVISGSTVEEYCQCSFYDKVLEQLGDSEVVVLRFSNKDSGETYDHVLSRDEIDALYCGLLLRVNNRELSNLLYRYNNPK